MWFTVIEQRCPRSRFVSRWIQNRRRPAIHFTDQVSPCQTECWQERQVSSGANMSVLEEHRTWAASSGFLFISLNGPIVFLDYIQSLINRDLDAVYTSMDAQSAKSSDTCAAVVHRHWNTGQKRDVPLLQHSHAHCLQDTHTNYLCFIELVRQHNKTCEVCEVEQPQRNNFTHVMFMRWSLQGGSWGECIGDILLFFSLVNTKTY